MSYTLNDKVAVVTGAGGTFGSAIAYALIRAGACVVLNDIEEEALGRVEGEISQRLSPPNKITRVIADVTLSTDVVRLIDTTLSSYGRLDILVNCAALLGGYPFLDYPEEEMKRMINLNLLGTLLCSQQAARAMKKSGGGCIIHIGSVGSARAQPNAVVYDACKGALDAGARAMAVDLAKYGIRINVISPSRPAAEEDYGTSGPPLGSDGITRQDLADAVVFFASDYSKRITGQSIWVDNGLTATLRWPENGIM